MCNSHAKTDIIRLRITPDEKRILVAAARRRDLTLSELIRKTATEAALRAIAA